MELNRIYTENCIETLERMSDDFLDMTLCSPPYDDLRAYNGYDLPLDTLIHLLYQKTKPGGVVVWVIGDKTQKGSESLSSFRQAIKFVEVGGFKLWDTMLYVKNNPIPSDCGKRYRQSFEYMFCFSKGTPKTFNPIKEPTKSAGKKIKAFRITQGGRGNCPDEDIGREIKAERKASNIFTYNVGTSSATDRIAFRHPAIFPERLAEDQIATWTDEGDIVYDCFMGSGTTAKAAGDLGRSWIGSEISPEYVDIAHKRLAGIDQTQDSLVHASLAFTKISNLADPTGRNGRRPMDL
ncbi:MAG: site-specific DNA-methyltransferase [Chloracidobacterium sp.]|nr:site-specific DNA-methyltransferase [Chloracidobacterium sp.]